MARRFHFNIIGRPPKGPEDDILAAIFLAVAGVAAAYLPARRASRIDPVRLLR